MNVLDWYIPVNRGDGFQFTCECGAVGYTHFDAYGYVPNMSGPAWTRYGGWPCPTHVGMWLRRFTLRNDNFWPNLAPIQHPDCHLNSVCKEISDCPPSEYSWAQLDQTEIGRLFTADPHHFNIIAREGGILGLRPLTELY